MRMIWLLSFLYSIAALSATVMPEPGLYTCSTDPQGNICDQRLRLIKQGTQVRALSIEYVGWCGSQGPYTYPCLGDECADEPIYIKWIDQKRYYWVNRTYGFKCNLKKVKN